MKGLSEETLSRPIVKIRGMSLFFGVHFLKKRILFACTPKQIYIFSKIRTLGWVQFAPNKVTEKILIVTKKMLFTHALSYSPRIQKYLKIQRVGWLNAFLWN